MAVAGKPPLIAPRLLLAANHALARLLTGRLSTLPALRILRHPRTLADLCSRLLGRIVRHDALRRRADALLAWRRSFGTARTALICRRLLRLSARRFCGPGGGFLARRSRRRRLVSRRRR